MLLEEIPADTIPLIQTLYFELDRSRSDTCSWSEDSLSFEIHDLDEFLNQVLQGGWDGLSFNGAMRELGFTIAVKRYTHEHFVRNNAEVLSQKKKVRTVKGVNKSIVQHGLRKFLTGETSDPKRKSKRLAELSACTQEASLPKSKYEWDVYINKHKSVCGLWWKDHQWDDKCCKQTVRNSYCTGAAGIGASESAANLTTENSYRREASEDTSSSPPEEKRLATWEADIPDYLALDQKKLGDALKKKDGKRKGEKDEKKCKYNATWNVEEVSLPNSKYEDDVYFNNQTSVRGSWWKEQATRVATNSINEQASF